MALTQVQGQMLAPGQTLSVNGITFPATQVPSADANTLDDYEEGTWTPVIAFGGNSVGITYSAQAGNYTKVGNMVFAHGTVYLSSKGSSTGSATISLPFVSKSGPSYDSPRSGGSVGYYHTFTSVTGLQFMVDHTSIVAGLFQSNSASSVSDGNFQNGSAMYGFYIIYQTN